MMSLAGGKPPAARRAKAHAWACGALRRPSALRSGGLFGAAASDVARWLIGQPGQRLRGRVLPRSRHVCRRRAAGHAHRRARPAPAPAAPRPVFHAALLHRSSARRRPSPSCRNIGRRCLMNSTRHPEGLRRGRHRRRPGRRHGGPRPGQPGPQRAAAGPRRPHQTLRRRDTAARHQGLPDPRSPAGGQGTFGAHDFAARTARSTSPSKTASSAWSTASTSTSGCANVPPAAVRCAPPARSRRWNTPTTAWPWCTSARARTRPARRRATPPRCVPAASSAPTAHARRWRNSVCPGAEDTEYVFAYHEIVRAPARKARRLRRHTLRRLLPRRTQPRLLRLGVPARRHAQHRHRQRRQGLFAARRHRHAARGRRHAALRDHPPRRRAAADEAAEALGRRPQRGARRRRRRRRGALLRRRHLLRHVRWPTGRRGGAGVPAHRQDGRAGQRRANVS